jgi:hypothetical protein
MDGRWLGAAFLAPASVEEGGNACISMADG